MKKFILFIFFAFIFLIAQNICYAASSGANKYYYFLSSQLLKSQQEYAKAAENIENLLPELQSQEDKAILFNELIQLNFLLSNYEKSREWAFKYKEINPDDNITDIIIAKSYLNEGQTDNAIEYLENILKNNKGNLDIFLNLMSIYTQDKKQQNAINFLEYTRINHINDEIKYYFLLLLHFENNDYDKTLSYIDKYITIFEPDTEKKARNIQSILQIIIDLFDKQYQKEKILDILKKLTEKDASNIQTRMFYIQLLIFEKNTNEAVKLLQDIENKIADNFKTSIEVLKLYIIADAEEKAMTYYNALKQKYPEQKELDFFFASLKEKQNKIDEAINLYKNLISDKTDLKIYESSILRLTDLLKKINKTDEAIDILLKAYNETKSYFVLQLILETYLDEEMLDKAEKITKNELLELEKKAPNQADKKKISELKYNYFLIIDKKGKKQEAIDLALKELENDPNNSNLLNFVGYSYVEQGINLEEAEKLLNKAIALNPEDPFITDSMGWFYYKKKNYALALDYLMRALQYESDEPTLLEHIADVYYATGDKQKALEYFKKSLENIKKQNKDYLRVKEKINKLQEESN